MNNEEALKLIIENNQKNKEKYENFVINDDNCCVYSWYIAMKNGRFNFKLFKLTGNDKFKLR